MREQEKLKREVRTQETVLLRCPRNRKNAWPLSIAKSEKEGGRYEVKSPRTVRCKPGDLPFLSG